MFGNKSVETLVVGAGPSGMIAALVLAQQGIETVIVDAADRVCARSNAHILHPTTLKLLDRLGLAERVLEKGYRIDKLLVYDDAQPRETIHLNELPVAFPYALSVPQGELEAILEDALRRERIHVRWDHRASAIRSEGNTLVVDVDRYCERGTGYAVSHTEHVIDKTYRYHARLVVAADGYNSLLRRLTKTTQSRLGPDHYYSFFEIETDLDHQRAIRVSLQDKLATAQYPLPGGHSRLSFQYSGLTLPPEYRRKDRESYQNRFEHPDLLDDPHLGALIEQRVPWATGSYDKVRYRAVAPFEKRYLKNPLQDRVFFLGDAARSFGPLSMTSINLGMQEAEQLAMGYKQSRRNGDSLHHLEAVGQSMVDSWTALAGVGKRSQPIEMADPWVCENRARILRALPATGETLERLAAQLFIHLSPTELADVF